MLAAVTYAAPIGPLWLRALVVGAMMLVASAMTAMIFFSPGAVASTVPLGVSLATGFAAFGVFLVAFGSRRALKEREKARTK